MSLKRFDVALECLYASIHSNGRTYTTDFSVGQCFYQMGDNETARKWLRQVSEYADAPEKVKNAVKILLAEMNEQDTRH